MSLAGVLYFNRYTFWFVILIFSRNSVIIFLLWKICWELDFDLNGVFLIKLFPENFIPINKKFFFYKEQQNLKTIYTTTRLKLPFMCVQNFNEIHHFIQKLYIYPFLLVLVFYLFSRSLVIDFNSKKYIV